MGKLLNAKVIFFALVAIALAIIVTIVYVITNYLEKSKWTFVSVDVASLYDSVQDASESELAVLRDPKSVAEMFFYQEGYGDSTETTIDKSTHSYKIISMKNADGYTMKAYVIQPGLKGDTGLWAVKRYIADPLPNEEDQ